jgi:NTP pyrophosphatase (non-canonical NTP hydrolase)
MKKIDCKLLWKETLSLWGINAQLGMVKEECAELIVAVNKYERGIMMPEYVVDEIADVYVMLEQLISILEIDDEAVDAVIQKKLARLYDRVNGEKHKKNNS